MFSGQIHVGLKMLMHRKGRLFMSMLGVAFAVLIMFLQLGFFHGINDSQAHMAKLLNADLVIMHKNRTNLNKWTRMQTLRSYQVDAVDGIAQTIPIYKDNMGLKNAETQQLRRIVMYAFPPNANVLNLPGFEALSEQLKVPGTVLYDARSRSIFGPMDVDDNVTLNGLSYKIIGHVEIGPNLVSDGMVLMSQGTWFRQGGDTKPIMVLVRLKPDADLEQVRNSILTELPPDMTALTPAELHQREIDYTVKAAPVGAIFGVGLIVGLVIGTIICYQILFNEITDHIPQYATLRAMGYSNNFLRSVILEEASVLAIFGFVPGLLSAAAVYWQLQDQTALLMTLTPDRIGLIFILTIIMCLGAGMLALGKVLNSDPADLY